MKKRIFAIPSLLAAGFMPVESIAMPLTPPSEGGKSKSLFDIFKLDHKYTLAGHRSHSSHSSHSSHRSSAGGSIYLPRAPVYSSPTYQPSAPAYQPPSTTPPASTPLKTLPGNAYRFKEIVLQVQFAMLAYGYYTGELDGTMNPEMRSGLMKLQSDYNLKVTGTITPETLTALHIVAE
ncbi:His-Xaa-Ser repeat protein HxsA [Mesorhizobium sp. M8A.F.Ca.ET.021.01.1.1]|uniref:His-Xaa-Ser repeat protein HxsA n=1 Tax=Mesorhizobium sp. M8A.F.Ca.ET.021.01.1.1 TaxID=2496757 RepID=UPI000FCC141D|nr:His-Xaa-Ser repeat protein HxsA [Mesorhizobium sp. M8A.F.Ca.ET.021.01.1.1]RUW57023.1 His-Xaa-Ser repeat protein HxsA [Mesorhizobium sp. M8A.F.Ca.ET.021.01.1.1]